MMLNEHQITQVWEGMIGAETRSLYFADLAARYTRQKQIITGVSFFLSSGAAAAIIGKAPSYVPVVLAFVVALCSAYSMAVNLDTRILTLAKLHAAWWQIATRYTRLWNHTGDEDADEQLGAIIDLEQEPSTLAATSAPNNETLLGKWQDRVFAMYHLSKPA
jgi:uncharacterized membrane protein YecN with MAPEG domain